MLSRAKLLEIAKRELDQDAVRLISVLLSSTTAKVRLGKVVSEPFTLDIGSPQGDGLSPVLFVLYLEESLKKIREVLPERCEEDKDIMDESQYADDCNWYSKLKSWLEESLEIIAEKFREFDLKVRENRVDRVEQVPEGIMGIFKAIGFIIRRRERYKKKDEFSHSSNGLHV